MPAKRVFEQIRKVIVEQGKRDPVNASHVISSLNWYRYEKETEFVLRLLPSKGEFLNEINGVTKLRGFNITTARKEFVIPAQVERVSKKMGNLFNEHYLVLDKLGFWLMKTPLTYFAENWAICAQKS